MTLFRFRNCQRGRLFRRIPNQQEVVPPPNMEERQQKHPPLLPLRDKNLNFNTPVKSAIPETPIECLASVRRRHSSVNHIRLSIQSENPVI
jgi:hypothetical protein